MKKIISCSIVLMAALGLMGCSSTKRDTTAINTSKSYQNPILAGFYPDPSICRVGSDYYLINSTFSYFPGLPVFHSKDLVNWKQIGNAIDRPDQLNFIGQRVTEGLFAPAISYHDGTFYIVCTHISRLGNFIITAKNPAGPWSDPVALTEVKGIDPSLFFDTDDKCYLVYNDDAPNNKPEYEGHRTIRIVPIDANTIKVTGENKILVNGGTDISKKPVWIEGPHIFKKDGMYYLIAAEGGTGDNHSEVVFRSHNVYGPYEPYKNNPILTQRDLDPARPNPITTTGHCDFVQTESGEWWSVFLACRPYEGSYFNTGRETFLAPVKWIDGWPVITKKDELVQYTYPVPVTKERSAEAEKLSGSFISREEFNNPTLDYSWVMLRNPKEKWYDIKDGRIYLKLRPEECHGKGNPSFLGKRQQQINSYAMTQMEFTAKSENEKAGLVIFQSEKNYYYFFQSVTDGKQVLQLLKYVKDHVEVVKELALPDDTPVTLKIESRGALYNFYYTTGSNKEILFANNIDGKYLSTKEAGGFVGSMYALYATSGNKNSTTTASFNWMEINNQDSK